MSKGYEPPQADAIITTATKEITTLLPILALLPLFYTRRR